MMHQFIHRGIEHNKRMMMQQGVLVPL